jgi:hypothetical protein
MLRIAFELDRAPGNARRQHRLGKAISEDGGSVMFGPAFARGRGVYEGHDVVGARRLAARDASERQRGAHHPEQLAPINLEHVEQRREFRLDRLGEFVAAGPLVERLPPAAAGAVRDGAGHRWQVPHSVSAWGEWIL